MPTATQDDLAVDAKSELLRGLRVAVCGGGGIASIELPRLVRELRRHGAAVRCVVSENALRFVGREALEWASASPVTVTPTGMADHICTEDLVVAMPATADLLAKLSLGLASDGVTTYLLSATGKGVPLVLCPTMHASLASAPISQEHRARLKALPALRLLAPRIEEGKEKALAPETLALEAAHWFHLRARVKAQKSAGRAFVSFGGTRARLDDVRCLSNLSTGRLGQALSRELYGRGLVTTLLQAGVSTPTLALEDQTLIEAEDFDAFREAAQGVDPGIHVAACHLAAVSDYLPSSPVSGKIPSHPETISLEFVRAPKIIALPNLLAIRWKLACKLTGAADAAGRETALRFLQSHGLACVLWNAAADSFGKETSTHAATLLRARDGEAPGETPLLGKVSIARALADAVLAGIDRENAERGA